MGVVAFAGYAIFLACNGANSAGGADTSGYLNSARLLAEGRLQSELRVPPELRVPAHLRHHFMPLGFDVLPHNPHLPPTYPPGLPLQLALAGKLFGWQVAPILTEVLMALGALWLCYLVARELGIESRLAGAGVVILATFPVFLFTSLQPLSDTPATAWCLLAVWLALRARRSRQGGWVVGCGAAFAMAVLVRATNAVLLPALLVLVGVHGKRLVLGAVGVLPFAMWQGYYNHTLYGSAFRSGYGPIHLTFALKYGLPTLEHFGYWLAVLTPAVLLVLPLLAGWRARSRELTALLVWFGAITGVYLFYQVSQETWWCLRFILPAFPALIFASLLALQACLRRGQMIAAIALSGWAIACTLYWTPFFRVLDMKAHEGAYVAACEKAREVAPPNALLASFYTTGAAYFYTDFPVLRWDLIETSDFIRYATTARETGRPIYALLFDGLEDDALQKRMPGEWSRVATVQSISLWKLEGLLAPAQP